MNGIPGGPVWFPLVPPSSYYPEDVPPWAGKGKKKEKMPQLDVAKQPKPVVVAKTHEK